MERARLRHQSDVSPHHAASTAAHCTPCTVPHPHRETQGICSSPSATPPRRPRDEAPYVWTISTEFRQTDMYLDIVTDILVGHDNMQLK